MTEHGGEAPPPADVPDSLYETVLALLGPAPVSVDDIIRETGQDAGVILAALMDMEISGAITRNPDGGVQAAV